MKVLSLTSILLLLTLQAAAYKQQSIDITVNGQKRNMVVFTPNELPAKNIGGSTDKAFGGIRQQKYEFDIAETGDYVIAFYADTPRKSDFVVGRASIQAKEFYTTGIQEMHHSQEYMLHEDGAVYDLQGRRQKEGQRQRGIYIRNGRKFIVL